MLKTILPAVGILVLASASAYAGQVSQAKSPEQFTEKFCGAKLDKQHIFVVPTSILTTEKSINCDVGIYTIRTAEPSDDAGHIVFNVDPPEGVENGLDCDGKADIGMETVAINCLPANMEAADHTKT